MHQLTGDASTNTQKPLAPPQNDYPQTQPQNILQVGIAIFLKVLWWIMQLSGASGITHYVYFFADSYGKNSVQASHSKPVRDLYKLGFIIASVCGGLLFILTVYCLITQKVRLLLLCWFLYVTSPNQKQIFDFTVWVAMKMEISQD